jgi:hypothetical protein
MLAAPSTVAGLLRLLTTQEILLLRLMQFSSQEAFSGKVEHHDSLES